MAMTTKRSDRLRTGAWMLALALVGFGVARLTTPATKPAAIAQEQQPPTMVGQMVPATKFFDLGNRTHQLGEVHGKPMILSVFAFDCDHCMEQLPKAQAFFQRHQAAGLRFWAVDGANGKREDVLGFAKKTRFNSPLFFDPQAGLADALRVEAYPMFYWVDKNGVIRAQVIGEFRDKDFEWLWQKYGK
jgi:peroxiredoxin